MFMGKYEKYYFLNVKGTDDIHSKRNIYVELKYYGSGVVIRKNKVLKRL